MKLLTAEELLYLHHRLIEETGGSHGVRDIGLLRSAVGAPSSGFGDEEFYPSLFEKAAVLMRSLVQNHPLVDGNKRTGISAAAIMLESNDRKLTASQQEFEDFPVLVATDHLSIETIAAWLEEHSSERSGS